jgi:hypothetical protein
MKLFAAIHVPEKFGSRPVFIDDFSLPPKKASNHSAGYGGSGFIVSGLRNGHSVKWPGSVFKFTGCAG